MNINLNTVKEWGFWAIIIGLFALIITRSCSTESISASFACVDARVAKFPTREELRDPELQRACAARAYNEDNHSVWLVWATAAADEGETPAEWWIRQIEEEVK